MRYLLLLLILLAGCGQKDTNDMWQVFRQRDFTGGENLSELPEKIKNNQLIRLENCLISPEGYIKEFFQTDTDVVVDSTGVAPNGGLVLNKTDIYGTYDVYTPYGGDNALGPIYTGNYSPITNTTINAVDFTSHAVTPAGVQPWYHIQHAIRFLDKIYTPNQGGLGIINLTDFAVINNGAIGLGSGNPRKLREYANRLWLVVNNGPLYFSNNGDASTWDALNLIYLPNRDRIIDFIPVQGGAIVLGLTSVYAMYGTDYTDITFIKIADNLQLGQDSSVAVGNTVFVYGMTAIYQITLNSIQEVQHDQYSYFVGKMNYNLTNMTSRIRGAYLPKRNLILFYYPKAYTYQGLWLDLKHQAMGKMDFHADEVCPIDSQYADMIFRTETTKIHRNRSVTTDRTTALASVIQTKHEDFGSTKDKLFREFVINNHTVLGSGVTIKYYLDGNAFGTTILNNSSLAAGETSFFLDNARGKTISFEITITTTKPFTIKELKVRLREVGQIE